MAFFLKNESFYTFFLIKLVNFIGQFQLSMRKIYFVPDNEDLMIISKTSGLRFMVLK